MPAWRSSGRHSGTSSTTRSRCGARAIRSASEAHMMPCWHRKSSTGEETMTRHFGVILILLAVWPGTLSAQVRPFVFGLDERVSFKPDGSYFFNHTDPDLVFRSEEHMSELQSRLHLVCRLLLEKKKQK